MRRMDIKFFLVGFLCLLPQSECFQQSLDKVKKLMERGRTYNKFDLLEQLEVYEKCLKQKEKSYQAKVEPEISLEALVGQRVTLACNLCVPPGNVPKKQSLQWRRHLVVSENDAEVGHDGEKFTYTDSQELVISDVSVEDVGRYQCLGPHATRQAIYQLDVTLDKQTRIVSEGENEPLAPDLLPDYNLMVHTDWSAWSTCSPCGQHGKHRRRGWCKVKTMKPFVGIEKLHIHGLDRFAGGLACRSFSMPPTLASLSQIRDRPSELQVGSCYRKCAATQMKKTIRDSNGDVIEVRSVDQGYRSVQDGAPKLAPTVRRDTLYRYQGQVISFRCPSAGPGSAVLWQKGLAVLDPLAVRNSTQGRVFIDIQQSLVIRNVIMADDDYYSCWSEGEHLATFTLRIKPQDQLDQLDTNNWAFNIAALTIILTLMSCVFCKMCMFGIKNSHNLR